MTKLYVAGPMRGIPEFNFPAFGEASELLREHGYETVDPAERDTYNGFDPTGMTGNEDLAEVGFDLRDALAWDLDQIARECDGVAVLPGWERSMGANAEVATARALGLKVLSVSAWVDLVPQDGDLVEGESGHGETYRGLLLPKGHDFERADERTLQTTSGGYYVLAKTLRKVEVKPDHYEEALDRMAEEGKGSTVEALTGEVRVTSETGGQKGRKAAELATIDPLALEVLAKVSGFGARKYESFNYLKGYDWTLSANAAFRHLLAGLQGEDNDPESGLPHFAHFAWHGLALTSFLLRGIGNDDRVSAMLAAQAEEREAA